MEIIDTIRINFDDSALKIMNLSLAFMMFGVALDMSLKDFKRIVEFPKAVMIGLSSQLILLPIATLIFLYFWDPWVSISLGLVLVSVCPGGNVSNFAVHLAKGNAALSVTMTSVVTLSAIVITPTMFAFWAGFVPEADEILKKIHLDPVRIILIIVQLIFIPLVLGMAASHYFPKIIAKIKKPIKTLSIIIFAAFIIGSLLGNYENIINHLHYVFLIVIVHNIMAFIIGYFWASAWKLEERDRRAISIETGIQNAGLGLILIFNFFDGIGGMTLVAAWWGIWDLISSFSLSLFWSRKMP